MEPIISEDIKHHVEALMSEWHVPGLSIAVFDKKTVTPTSFGLASIEPKVEVTPDTIFDLASTSKSLTAAAVAKLATDNRHPDLTWNTPVSELLKDEFVLADSVSTTTVTVEDILSHRSGMPRHDLSYMGKSSQDPDDAKSITNNLRNLPLSASVRTKYQYCNMMFTVAAYLVEKKSQKTFERFVQENFLDPLGMHSTYFQPSTVLAAEQGHRFAQPYIWREGTKKYTMAERRDQPEGIGAGLVQSTAVDYAKWVQAMMTQETSLMPTEAYEQLIQPRITLGKEDPEDTSPFTSNKSYALGLGVELYRGHRLVIHSGSETGYSSIVAFLPTTQFGLVILSNGGNADDVIYAVAMEIIDKVLGVLSEDKHDWVEWVRQMSAKEGNEPDFREKLRSELLGSSSGTSQALSLPLNAYMGTYTNPGYHRLVVSEKEGSLYVDASDRGMPFTIKFEHVQNNRVFIGEVEDRDYCTSYIRTEFEMDGNGQVNKMGLDLCGEISPSLIWFTKNE